MTVPTWILAISTAILAVSGPVAVAVWLSGRKQDAVRRERERQDEERAAVLKSARDEFVPKSWVAGSLVFGVIGVMIAWGSWSDRKKMGPGA